MGSSANIIILLFAISKSTFCTKVEYQPIKIIVNENFNDPSGKVELQLPVVGSNFVHQGANFYFNPEVKLPAGLIPPHIEALLASLHQESISTELENKIHEEEEVINPLPELTVKDDTDIVETIKDTEESILVPIGVPPELPVLKPIEITVEESEPLPIELIDEDFLESSAPQLKPIEVIEDDLIEPAIPIEDESEVIIHELIPMPEPPVLPPLSLDFIQNLIAEEEVKVAEEAVKVAEEEVKVAEEAVIVAENDVKVEEPVDVELPCVTISKEEPVLLDERIAVLPSLPNIPMGPILEPIEIPKKYESVTVEKFMKPNPDIVNIITVEKDIIPESFSTSRRTFEEAEVEKDLVSEIVKEPRILIQSNVRPLVPLPKLNYVLDPKTGQGNRFLYSMSHPGKIVGEHIAPNILLLEKYPELAKFVTLKKGT